MVHSSFSKRNLLSKHLRGVDQANPPLILCMLVYELYAFNKTKGYELIGVLPERRKNPARMTKNSVMNWGKMLLDEDAESKDIFFKPVRIEDICLPIIVKS